MPNAQNVLEALHEHSAGSFLVSDSGYTCSADHIISSSKVLASSLISMGIRKGSPVGYALTNGVESAGAILGLMAQGYVAVAINLQAGDKAIQYAIEHSEAQAIIVDESSIERLAELTMVPCVELSSLCAEPGEAILMAQGSNTEDIALVMYTSGTTGVPKGVQLSHRALLSGGGNTAEAHQLSSKDTALCVLPLYHINGLCVTLMAPLVSGGLVVIPTKFSVSAFWHIIAERSVTWFSVVPTQISFLLHSKDVVRPSDTLRFGRSASAPLSASVQQAFEERFGIKLIETMGMTETAAQLLSNPLPPGVQKIGSPGIAFGNTVIIADENQNELPRGQEGEILVHGLNLMSGYLKNEEATSEALTADGWLRSGDLGKMDADGYVFVTGRLKELIIKGGENIAPREIDDVLYGHPQVIEAAAFPVACDEYGERPEAAVVVEPGDNWKMLKEKLIASCIEQLGAFKAPTVIYALDELPKGPSGKIQRSRLSEICANLRQA